MKEGNKNMTSSLQVFNNFEGMNVTIIIDENGNPLFELYSTGMALGQTKESKGKLYARKDRIDQNLINAEITAIVRDGQQFLNESMLYDFMLEVKTDKCKPFRKWVTNVVLPTINKYGVYMTEEVIEKTLTDPDFIIQLATQLKEERQKRLFVEQQLEEAQPKLDKYGVFIDAEGTYTFEQVSKMLSTRSKEEGSKIKVNKKTLPSILRDCGIISKNKIKGRYKNLPNKGFENYFNISCDNNDRDDIDSELTRIKTIGIDYIYDILLDRKEKGKNLVVMG